MTQNGQPLYKWPFPPFIDKGGECLTMWDLFPLLYFPIYISHIHVRVSHIADLPTFPSFPLVAGNLHENAQLQTQMKTQRNKYIG